MVKFLGDIAQSPSSSDAAFILAHIFYKFEILITGYREVAVYENSTKLMFQFGEILSVVDF